MPLTDPTKSSAGLPAQPKNYISTIYDESLRPITSYPDELIAHLCKKLSIPRDARVLDLGCGRGDFINAFHRYGLRASALDIEPESAKIADGVELKKCDVEKQAFPFADNSFDLVFSKSVIEHLDRPDSFVEESYRVLRPGGRILIMVPDWVSQMKIYFDDHTHRQPYSAQAVQDLLKMKGFEAVQAEIFYQLPILWKYPMLKVLSRLLQCLVPVTARPSIKFIRWSIELMVLGEGVKPDRSRVQ